MSRHNLVKKPALEIFCCFASSEPMLLEVLSLCLGLVRVYRKPPIIFHSLKFDCLNSIKICSMPLTNLKPITSGVDKCHDL
jgi:hypothetical protein